MKLGRRNYRGDIHLVYDTDLEGYYLTDEKGERLPNGRVYPISFTDSTRHIKEWIPFVVDDDPDLSMNGGL